MTVSVATMPTTHAPARAKPTGRTVTNVLSSEWTKIRTVRSTYWTLAAAAITTIGLSAIVCAIFAAQWDGISPKDRLLFDPASLSLTGGVLAQLAIAVLGVLVMTSEYGSKMIRTTFAAVPQRVSVLAAKATVFSAVTLTVTTVSCFIAFFVGQAIMSGEGIGVGIGSPNAARTVIGTGLYLAILGLLALGIGTLIRKTAGAITAVVGLIFVLPTLASFLPSSLSSVQKFLPSNAGQAIINGNASSPDVALLAPWIGLGVFFLYAVAALIAGSITLVRRDA